MRNLMITASMALLFGGVLSAAASGSIRLKDGTSNAAHDIVAETVSGILWESAPRTPGARIRLWDVETVNYNGQTMDDYNRMARALSGGRGATLIKDGESYLKEAAPPGYNATQWKRIQLSCSYYAAMGHYLNGDYASAIAGLEAYIKEAEKADNIEKNSVLRASFASKVSGQTVSDAGGLNRFYLDALETLGMCYIRQGDGKSASEKAFKPLQDLTGELARTGGREYFDWGIRALRASADYAEGEGDFKAALAAYDELQAIAMRKEGGRPSRAPYEAQLKGGFMMIASKDTRGAQARFNEAVNNWNNARGLGVKNPPRGDWLTADTAYLTAGSFVGVGMVKAIDARRVEQWADALEHFSTALSIFASDDEIRSMALLGAANAAAQLAELNKDRKTDVKGVSKALIAENYAKLSEKYVSELQTLFGRTKAAESETLESIQATINKYKGD